MGGLSKSVPAMADDDDEVALDDRSKLSRLKVNDRTDSTVIIGKESADRTLRYAFISGASASQLSARIRLCTAARLSRSVESSGLLIWRARARARVRVKENATRPYCL